MHGLRVHDEAVTSDDGALWLRLTAAPEREQRAAVARTDARLDGSSFSESPPLFSVTIEGETTTRGPYPLRLTPDEADAALMKGSGSVFCTYRVSFSIEMPASDFADVPSNMQVLPLTMDETRQRIRLNELVQAGRVTLAAADPAWAEVAEGLQLAPASGAALTHAIFDFGGGSAMSLQGLDLVTEAQLQACRDQILAGATHPFFRGILFPGINRSVENVRFEG
jgi:hypothetical protein